MKKITTIGLDLAKNVFHTVCCDKYGKVVGKKMLKRSQALAYFSNLPPCLSMITTMEPFRDRVNGAT